MTKQDDDYVSGLRDAGPFEFTANWQPDDALFETLMQTATAPKTMRIVTKGSRWFGVHWFTASYLSQSVSPEFSYQTEADGGMASVSMFMSVEKPFVKSRAEWWRRMGYYAIACPLDALEALLKRWRGDAEAPAPTEQL